MNTIELYLRGLSDKPEKPLTTMELYLRGLSDKPKKPLTTMEMYLQGIKVDPPKPRTVIECYLAGVACDEWQEQDHPRDDDGKFTSSGRSSTGRKKPVAKSIIKSKINARRQKAVSLSPREYGLLHHGLNEYIAGKDIPKGKIMQWWTGEYCYEVLINGYNDYVPLMKRKIR